MQDTSINGAYIKFYEELQLELSVYSDEKIETMKETIKFMFPSKVDEINKHDKMRIIYEYSLLP